MYKLRNKFLKLSIILTSSSFFVTSPAFDLLEAYNMANESAPETQIAYSEKKASEQKVSIALAKFLPAVNGQLSSDLYQSNSETNKKNSLYVEANQNIFSGPALLGYKSAQISLAAAKLNYEAAKQQLILNVVEKYFNVLNGIAKVDLEKNRVKAKEKKLEQAQEKFDLGMVTIADVHAAKAGLDSAVVKKLDAELEYSKAVDELVELTGKTPCNYNNAPAKLLNIKEAIPLLELKQKEEDYVKRSLTSNPSLKGFLLKYKLAKASLDGKLTEFLPSIKLSGSLSNTKDQGENIFEDPKKSLSIKGNINLLSGGATLAETKQKKAELVGAASKLEQARRSIYTQAKQAYRSMNIYKQQIEALKQAVKSSESSLTAVEAAYEVGTNTIHDVLDAQNDMLDNKNKLQKANHNYIVARCKLDQTTGNLNVQQLIEINKLLSKSKDLTNEKEDNNKCN